MDQQVKERVVGAVVLVLAAVIFIPMVFVGSPIERARGGDAADLQRGSATGATRPAAARSAPASNTSGFSSRIVPLGQAPPAPGAAREAASDQAGERVDGTGPELRSVLPKSKPVQLPPPVTAVPKAEPKQPPVRSAIVAPAAQTLTDGWVVQLGSFSSARNAHALRDRLQSKGYKAFARTSGNGAEEVTRVYVGPDATREGAQQRVARLLDETRLHGIVIRDPK